MFPHTTGIKKSILWCVKCFLGRVFWSSNLCKESGNDYNSLLQNLSHTKTASQLMEC